MFGAFLSALVGFGISEYFGIYLPALVMIPLLIVVGMIGGAFWAIVPAVLKAKRGVHEVITTIMMNYVATTLMVFFVGDLTSPFGDKNYGSGNYSPQTPLIDESGWIPTVFGQTFSAFHWGFFLSIIVAIVLWVILWKTQLGYETRAVGHNPYAAKYGGISVPKNLIIIMLISGALGGLGGAVEVMGYWHRFVNGFSPGYGFDGIAVALIGGNHPIGVIFGGLLFGELKSGGQVLQLKGISKDVANTLKGMIVFFVAIPLLSKQLLNYFGYSTHLSFVEKEIKKLYGLNLHRK